MAGSKNFRLIYRLPEGCHAARAHSIQVVMVMSPDAEQLTMRVM